MSLNEAIVVRIIANGELLNLGLGAHVVQFQYEDSEKEDDLLTMTFADPFVELVDLEQFQESSEWTVQWGFAGKLHPARKVIVKRPRFAYGQVEIQALDKGSQLKIEESWSTFQKTTPQRILEEIASAHGLTLEFDNIGFDSIPFFAQAGRTHYDILKYLQSRAEDHYFKVVGDKLLFKKRNLNAAPKAQYAYMPGAHSKILSFDIQIKDQDNAKSSLQTTAVSIDPFTQKTKTYKADEGSVASQNLGNARVTRNYKTGFSSLIQKITGASVPHKNMPLSTGKTLPLPLKSNEEMNALVKSKRHQSLMDNVEANFDISADQNDPFLQSGDLIEVRGIGKKFSGSYQIVSITHDLSDGYKYSINAKRNAVSNTDQNISSPILNGPINKKKSQGQITELLDKTIKGSESLSAYGQAGRILS